MILRQNGHDGQQCKKRPCTESADVEDFHGQSCGVKLQPGMQQGQKILRVQEPVADFMEVAAVKSVGEAELEDALAVEGDFAFVAPQVIVADIVKK